MRKLRITEVKTNLTKILNTVLRAGIQIQGNSIPNAWTVPAPFHNQPPNHHLQHYHRPYSYHHDHKLPIFRFCVFVFLKKQFPEHN